MTPPARRLRGEWPTLRWYPRTDLPAPMKGFVRALFADGFSVITPARGPEALEDPYGRAELREAARALRARHELAA